MVASSSVLATCFLLLLSPFCLLFSATAAEEVAAICPTPCQSGVFSPAEPCTSFLNAAGECSDEPDEHRTDIDCSPCKLLPPPPPPEDSSTVQHLPVGAVVADDEPPPPPPPPPPSSSSSSSPPPPPVGVPSSEADQLKPVAVEQEDHKSQLDPSIVTTESSSDSVDTPPPPPPLPPPPQPSFQGPGAEDTAVESGSSEQSGSVEAAASSKRPPSSSLDFSNAEVNSDQSTTTTAPATTELELLEETSEKSHQDDAHESIRGDVMTDHPHAAAAAAAAAAATPAAATSAPPPPPPTDDDDEPTIPPNRGEARTKSTSKLRRSNDDEEEFSQSVVTVEEILACSAAAADDDGSRNEAQQQRCREARYEYLVNALAMDILQQQQRVLIDIESEAAHAAIADAAARANASKSNSALYGDVDLVKSENVAQAPAASSKLLLAPIPRVNRIKYQSFFFDFALARHPLLVSKATPGAGTTGAGRLMELGVSCLKQVSSTRFAPGETRALREICEDALLDDDAHAAGESEPNIAFQVPFLLANDLLQRASTSSWRQRWPAVTAGTTSAATRNVGLHSGCPAGLHELLFVKTGRLHVVAFPENQTALLYPKVLNRVEVRPPPPQNGLRVASANAVKEGGSVVVVNRPHFPWKFDLEAAALLLEDNAAALVSDSADFPLLARAKGFQTTTGQGEMLFIPAGFQVAWQYLAPSVVLRHCYLDASNLQLALSRLELEGLVDDEKARLWQAVSDHVQSGTAFMQKLPVSTITAPLPWTAFKHPGSPEAAAAALSLAMQNRGSSSPGSDGVRGNQRFQRWQMDRLWHRTIDSLTRPRPSAPDVVKVGRGEVTLRWQQNFLLGENGQERGLNEEPTGSSSGMEARKAAKAPHFDAVPSLSSSSSSGVRGYLVTATPVTLDALLHGTNFTRQHSVSSASVLEVSVGSEGTTQASSNPSTGQVTSMFLFEDEAQSRLGNGAEVLASSGMIYAPVRGLRPGTIYVFSVSALTRGMGDFTGTPTAPVKTLGSTTPTAPTHAPTVKRGSKPGSVFVEWGMADDGGAPLTEFRVEYRPADGQAHHQSWKSTRTASAGGRRHVELTNLVPGMKYVFRVSAANANGFGAPGPTSPATSVPGGNTAAAAAADDATPGFPASRGRRRKSTSESDNNNNMPDVGQQQAQGHTSISGPASDHEPCYGPRVVFDDRTETLEIMVSAVDADAHAVSVWAAHYSPRAFKLQNVEVVAAEPFDASTSLRNNPEVVAGRVVLVERGAVPLRQKVQYAQRAGAVGVLIIDTSRACDEQFDQSCCPGGDKANGEGFAAQDKAALWESIMIPSALIRFHDGEFLMDLMK